MFNAQSLHGLSLRAWKVFVGLIDHLPKMIKLKLNKSHGNWSLAVFQSVRKTMSWNAFFNDKKGQST